jgi:hypothetical protein
MPSPKLAVADSANTVLIVSCDARSCGSEVAEDNEKQLWIEQCGIML